MGTVTVYTAARMLAIEQNTIVDGDVDGAGNLILTKQSGATVNAGSVIGPTGTPGVSLAAFNAGMAATGPVGMICDYIGATAPTGWLTMIGQTITNGQTAYPLLWAILPTAMKSGANIVFPDTRGRFAVNQNPADAGFDTIGELGGVAANTLTSGNLPVHAHSMPHTHAMDHDHPAAGLKYSTNFGGGVVAATTGTTDANAIAFLSSGSAVEATTPWKVDVPNLVAATGGVSTPNTGSIGNADPVSNIPPYVVFLKMIKAV